MRRDLDAILLSYSPHLLTTGFRLSDVTGLLMSDVDLAAGQIVRRTLKRGKTVALELHPELRLALVKRPPENLRIKRG
jgi:integrase